MKLIGLSGTTISITEELEGTTASRHYTDGILQAGGLPVLIPYGYESNQVQEICDRIDALILTGGEDVNPAFYGEDPIGAIGTVNPERDDLEFRLVTAMMERKKPILGICRGIQVLNVVLGGSLYQDIPKQVRGAISHRQKGPRGYLSHRVAVAAGSKLSEIVGSQEIWVNSFHHQSVKELAPHFIVSATTSDGVIEAIELPKYPFLLGVQWHPENLWQKNESAALLFRALVEAAG